MLTVGSNVANSITAVKNGGTAVNASNYTIDGLKLTIKKEYLATLTEGEKTITVTLDKGAAVTCVVTIADTTE